MFQPLNGHHQAFFETSSHYAAYNDGIPTMFTEDGDTSNMKRFIKIIKVHLLFLIIFMKLLRCGASPSFVNIVGIPTMYTAY
jgi:hypothetical protein